MPAGRISSRLERLVRKRLRPMVRFLFRPRLEGVEHLPSQGPYLLVANHSAGIGIAEILCFLALYVTEVGPERPLAGFAHPLGFRFGASRRLWESAGLIPSTYEAAEAALAESIPILVFPGGDHETMRPIWQARSVDFGGRRGFLRIARKANVPIVPMGIAGSHYTAPMLFRAKWLAWLLILPRALGIKRWGVSLLGALGAVALWFLPWAWPWRIGFIWLWLSSVLTFAPILPATIRFRIGVPIEPESLFKRNDHDLHEALRCVEAAVQALVRAP